MTYITDILANINTDTPKDEETIIKLNKIKEYLKNGKHIYIPIPTNSINNIYDLYYNNISAEPNNFIECLYYSFYYKDEETIIKLNKIKEYLNDDKYKYIPIPTNSINNIYDLYYNNICAEPNNFIECLYYSFYYLKNNNKNVEAKYMYKALSTGLGRIIFDAVKENYKNKLKKVASYVLPTVLIIPVSYMIYKYL